MKISYWNILIQNVNRKEKKTFIFPIEEIKNKVTICIPYPYYIKLAINTSHVDVIGVRKSELSRYPMTPFSRTSCPCSRTCWAPYSSLLLSVTGKMMKPETFIN